MLFNRDLSWIQSRVWGRLFESSASGICVLTVQIMVPELLQIGPIVSVDLSVCSTLWGPTFRAGRCEINRDFTKKMPQKRELEPVSVGEADHFRCHLAEVVALSSSGDCGATFPPRSNWWRRSCQRTPVVPPVPAGSILVTFFFNPTQEIPTNFRASSKIPINSREHFILRHPPPVRAERL